jgi:GxxExxY protein
MTSLTTEDAERAETMKNFNELTEAIIGAAMDGTILLEIKAIESLLPIHDAQLLSYLKLGGWKIGLSINFNVELLKNGLRRRVFGLVEEVIL